MPYKAFRTADGDVLIGAGNDRLFAILCKRLEKAEWVLDERFVDNSARVANRDVLESAIEEVTMRRTTQVCQAYIIRNRFMPSPNFSFDNDHSSLDPY